MFVAFSGLEGSIGPLATGVARVVGLVGAGMSGEWWCEGSGVRSIARVARGKSAVDAQGESVGASSEGSE